MTYYSLSALFNASASLLLGIFALLKNPKERLNKALFFWCLTAGLWSVFYFIWQLETQGDKALIWTRLLMLGAIWVPIAYFRVVILFLNIEKDYKIFLYFNYFLNTIFSILLATPLMVDRVEALSGFNFWPKPGWAYAPFLTMFIGLSLYSAYLSFRALKIEQSPTKKLQIQYMLLGIAISIAGGSTNYFLWYDIPIKPYGNILASTYVIFTFYAIFKYHLLDIKVIATELLTFILWIIILFQIFLAKTLTEQLINGGMLIIMLIFGILLIRSVNNEVKRREEIQKLADSLTKATNELTAANVRLKELDQFKNDFISIASHQMKTPLTSIKGLLSMILEGFWAKKPKQEKEELAKVYASTQQLINLVDTLLNISRIETGRMAFNFAMADIAQIVTNIMSDLAPLIKAKNLELSFTAEPLPKISVDSLTIRQVIMNLIDNAVKYTPEGKIAIELKQENDNILFKITDTGIGFSSEQGKRFFEKFYRTTDGAKANAKGSGVGLYAASEIIKAHHGQIGAESPGTDKGSTFWFTLPIK